MRQPSHYARTAATGFGLATAVASLLVLGLWGADGWARPEHRLPPAPTSEVESSVIYPPQRLPLRFDHGRHLARGVGCVVCHEQATSSRSVVDRLLPTEAVCSRCHPIDRARSAGTTGPGQPPTACRACHPTYDERAPVERLFVPPANLKFSHFAHRDSDCAVCHGALRSVGLATRAHLPGMATCLTCHREGGPVGADAACTTCHLSGVGGRVRTQLPDGVLVPTSPDIGRHGPGFARAHAVAARQQGATCSACHEQSECIDCHAGTQKPMGFHRGDYAHSHAIEARRGTPDCSACHRVATFCVACHERTGVGARGPSAFEVGAEDPTRRFHPPGWSGPGGRHGSQARRNLDTCASCHRDDFCAECHSPRRQLGSRVSVSPHPPGWRGSRACEALDRKNRRMCLRCHVREDELGCHWQAQPSPAGRTQ